MTEGTESLFHHPLYVWHDDIRPAPTEGNWAWVRTNEEAIRLLSEREVDGISLDHDLGGLVLHQLSAIARGKPDGLGVSA